MSHRARYRWLAGVLILIIAASAAACRGSKNPSATPSARPSAPTTRTIRPNVVFILTDDLSWNLVRYMPQVQRMETDGTTFTQYVVTDSLCCPSRSSIFTGNFPHNTGVFTNNAPDGGFGVFHARGEEAHTYANALQGDGYATGMMGKYLNGYQPKATEGGSQPYVPPGWTQWDVAGNAYGEFNYDLNANHTIVHHGHAATDYLTDVLSGAGTAFIKRQAAAHTPFTLEIATFAPHEPYTPAPADTKRFAHLVAPRTPAYDTLPTAAPSWLKNEPPLAAVQQRNADVVFRERAQAVQAVDRMIAKVRATLTAAGVANDTYVVFSSDNGYHIGEYRLLPGKQTAFDTDVRVPLVVVGPGVPAGMTRDQIVQNTDLAPTFEELAGAPVAPTVDGHSLIALLRPGPVADWRTAALIEHHGPNDAPDDPDAQPMRNGAPTTYEAMRTATYTYVEYADGEKEYYDRAIDPYELHNVVASLTADRLAALHAVLIQLERCHGGAACWAAGHATL